MLKEALSCIHVAPTLPFNDYIEAFKDKLRKIVFFYIKQQKVGGETPINVFPVPKKERKKGMVLCPEKHAIQLGDIAITGIGEEIFNSLMAELRKGLDVKNALPRVFFEPMIHIFKQHQKYLDCVIELYNAFVEISPTNIRSDFDTYKSLIEQEIQAQKQNPLFLEVNYEQLNSNIVIQKARNKIFTPLAGILTMLDQDVKKDFATLFAQHGLSPTEMQQVFSLMHNGMKTNGSEVNSI